MSISIATVETVIVRHLPGRKIVKIEDRGVWIRHNFQITLDAEETLYLKVDQSFPASQKEAFICGLLAEHNLPAPPVVALDISGTLIPAPYIIQKHIGGVSLAQLLAQESVQEHPALYFALGQFYKELHSIHHPHSGWIDGPGIVYPQSPNAHQYEEVIVKIAQQAVDLGLLTTHDHQRLRRIWGANLTWLDQHQPTLVGGSLPWTVYLAKTDGAWHVTKLMDLEDLLYWDAAWDVANIRYPAFGETLTPKLWEAFQAGYGRELPSMRRLKLYVLLQRIDAALGNYLAPKTIEQEYWKATAWKTFPHMINEVETLQE